MFCLLLSFLIQTLFPGWLVYKLKLCYSNLWLVALHPCFQPAIPQLPTPLPYICKTNTVWQLEIHLLCCRAILWESHCSGLSVPSLLLFLIGTVRTFLVRWVNTTWGWSHLSLSLGQVALLSLGGMINSECQRCTSTFQACRSLAGHTSVVAAESVGVSLALDVVVC